MLIAFLIFLAVWVAIGFLIMYFRWLETPNRSLAMAGYTYPRALYVGAAATVAGTHLHTQYEEYSAYPDTTVTDAWVITDTPGVHHYAQASLKDNTEAWCIVHLTSSYLGEGFYKGEAGAFPPGIPKITPYHLIIE